MEGRLCDANLMSKCISFLINSWVEYIFLMMHHNADEILLRSIKQNEYN